jgi:hypothetical protein
LQAGYLHRTRGRSTGGTLRGWETTVYETPDLLTGALDLGPPLGGRHPVGSQDPEAVSSPPLDLVPMPVEGPSSVVMGLHVADMPRPAERSCTPDAPVSVRPQRAATPPRGQTPAEEVLAYMNTVHGRQFQDTTQIAKLLARGATVEECYLVIDWSFAIDRLESPTGYEKYFNTTSPFRFANFDRLLDRARRWDAAGRPSHAQQQIQALSQESLLDHPATARHIAGAQQVIERFHSRNSNGSLFGLPTAAAQPQTTSTNHHTGDPRDRK